MNWFLFGAALMLLLALLQLCVRVEKLEARLDEMEAGQE